MAAWALTCILFMLLPGPDMALVTGWAVGSGTRAAWLSVLGIISSFLIYAALCLSGVAALVYASSSLISIMQVLGGGCYLFYLALIALRTEGFSYSPESARRVGSPFTSGFLSNLSNPKQMIFLLTVLPAFAAADPSLGELSALLAVLLTISLLFWLAWISLFSRIAARLTAAEGWLPRLAALCLAALGAWLILSAF